MKRPVWRYSLETTTNAPLTVVKARLESLESPLQVSVCAPWLGGSLPKTWRLESVEPLRVREGWLCLAWAASMGGLHESASVSVLASGSGCRLRVEGRLKGWPLLWKVGLFGWRSEGLLQRFVDGL